MEIIGLPKKKGINAMNNNMKEKWANRTAYAILALLLIAAVTVTVVAIVSTVNQRKEPLPEDPSPLPPSDEVNGDNTGEENTDQTGGEQPEPPAEETEKPETEKEPETQVFVLPAEGYVMKDYSEDVLVFSPTMNDYRVHMGVDIAGKVGDPVYAFCEGTVKEIRNDPFMGMTVVLSHAGGIESRYMNLANELPENIKVGATVAVGSVIGAIGETALAECADSPHLHFEIFAGGKQVSPSGYITFPSDAPTFDENE